MRILLITPRLPYPPHRGDRLRVWNLLRRLSGRHEFHLFALYQEALERESIVPLKALCASVTAVQVPLTRSLMSVAAALPGARPLQVAYFWSRAALRDLSALARRVHYDLAHVHLLRMIPYAEQLAPEPKILDLTDAISLYWDRFVAVTRNPLLRWARGEELARVRAYERRVREFTLSLVCSERDREVLQRTCPGARVGILPNGVDLQFFSANGGAPEPDTLIFTGNLSYWPNQDAILHFCRTVWPRVRAVRPARLLIVGQSPGRRVRRLARLPGITVTGTVPDLRPYYRRARVAVCPVRYGAGTPIKILESLALGIPVMSTRLACAGMGVRAGKELLVADSPEEQAAAVMRLLDDAELGKALSRAGRIFVEERHDWDAIADHLDRYYREIAA